PPEAGDESRAIATHRRIEMDVRLDCCAAVGLGDASEHVIAGGGERHAERTPVAIRGGSRAGADERADQESSEEADHRMRPLPATLPAKKVSNLPQDIKLSNSTAPG